MFSFDGSSLFSDLFSERQSAANSSFLLFQIRLIRVHLWLVLPVAICRLRYDANGQLRHRRNYAAYKASKETLPR
jgi:hypothetical protein